MKYLFNIFAVDIVKRDFKRHFYFTSSREMLKFWEISDKDLNDEERSYVKTTAHYSNQTRFLLYLWVGYNVIMPIYLIGAEYSSAYLLFGNILLMCTTFHAFNKYSMSKQGIATQLGRHAWKNMISEANEYKNKKKGEVR